MRKFAVVLAVAAAALGVAALAAAGPSKEVMIGAKLDAMQEIPHVKAPKAKGSFTGTIVGGKLKWRLTFSGLTGRASAAHIHVGAMGKAGAVLVALCGPCKTGQRGTAKVSAMVLRDIQKHLTYVNVHTAKHPNGEIRGQVSAH
jgi:CHRD domain